MRNELHLMELVDRYLDGAMNAHDRAAFEQRLSTNDELRSLMEDQQKLREAARRVPVRAAARKAYRKYRWGKWAGGGAAGAVILVAVTAAIFLWNANGKSPSGGNSEASNAAFAVLSDTTGTHLPPFILMVDPAKDTTVITPNGIVLDIPKGAFVDDQGRAITMPVRLTLLEALDPLDIMKAGLSTMSGDTLLETGGMFYIDAQVNGKAVKIDLAKPLTAMVPADETKPGMMLYQGVKDARGIIDWRDPKPLKRSLVPVDITTLNFYPPGYEAKLAEIGQDVTNKTFKDSLYYSFALASNSATGVFAGSDSAYTGSSYAEKLFVENCASCHMPGRDLTGPALKGAQARWKGKGDIREYVRNAQELIAAGNVRANELYIRSNKIVMPPCDLTTEEIEAILQWVDDPQGNAEGIDPAKVKAIWNERFDNTNLATKAFEERMRSIHGTCSNAVLDAYVNGLDKDLSTIDSQVVAMGHPEFEQFAERNDGRVDLPPVAADRLRLIYSKWSQAYAEAVKATQEQFNGLEDELDARSDALKAAWENSPIGQRAKLFNDAFPPHLRNAVRASGISIPSTAYAPPRMAYVVPVVISRSWFNCDRSIAVASVPVTQQVLTVEVKDRNRMEAMRGYLLPKESQSFQRLDETAGRLEGSLASGLGYDMVCLANSDGANYWFRKEDVHAGTVEARLQQVDEAELRRAFSSAGLQRENAMLNEAAFVSWSAADRTRRRGRIAKQRLREDLSPVIFPCRSKRSEIVPVAIEFPEVILSDSVLPVVNKVPLLSQPSPQSNEMAPFSTQGTSPEYPGGPKAMQRYITSSIQYPEDLLAAGIGGVVYVQFVIDENGAITDVSVLKGIDPRLDAEAMRIVKNMPPWTPGNIEGKFVRCRMTMPVRFVAQ